METASKKRKICHEDEEDEEEKIEKFFALIKNIQEARDHLLMLNDSDCTRIKNRKKMKKIDQDPPAVSVWVPSFQREDFMGQTTDQLHHNNYEQLKNPNLVGLSSESKGESEKLEHSHDIKDCCIDLKLSL